MQRKARWVDVVCMRVFVMPVGYASSGSTLKNWLGKKSQQVAA